MTTPAPLHPAALDLDAPHEIARWRPLVQWILVIPHLIVLYALTMVASFLLIIVFFAVLFTRRVPAGLHTFLVMTNRYGWRTSAYAGFTHDRYPPFDFEMSDTDPAVTPTTLSLARPEQLNRWLPLVKWLLLIPHYIVLTILGLVAGLVWVVAFFAVLFSGRFPAGMRAFVVGVMRWNWRVNAYFYLLRDEYPPFSLSA